MKRWNVIQRFIDERGYKSFLEIGRRYGETFDRINIHEKMSVDPAISAPYNMQTTSDDFFESCKTMSDFDIIFIDGLHHADQVKRDIENSLKHISLNGVILLHDCSPLKEEYQIVPQSENKSLAWCGTVWKAFVGFQGIKTCVNTDHGIGIIEAHNVLPFDAEPKIKISKLSYKAFDKNRVQLLNLISPRQFDEFYFNVHNFV